MPGKSDWLEDKVSSNGTPTGPRLRGSMFVPPGMGLVFEASDGKLWQLRLAQDANGGTVYDENGQPTTELLQVNP
jgi:hypothetical protein